MTEFNKDLFLSQHDTYSMCEFVETVDHQIDGRACQKQALEKLLGTAESRFYHGPRLEYNSQERKQTLKRYADHPKTLQQTVEDDLMQPIVNMMGRQGDGDRSR